MKVPLLHLNETSSITWPIAMRKGAQESSS
jgi:hypothetical protein